MGVVDLSSPGLECGACRTPAVEHTYSTSREVHLRHLVTALVQGILITGCAWLGVYAWLVHKGR